MERQRLNVKTVSIFGLVDKETPRPAHGNYFANIKYIFGNLGYLLHVAVKMHIYRFMSHLKGMDQCVNQAAELPGIALITS
jgi:hypothetical protein